MSWFLPLLKAARAALPVPTRSTSFVRAMNPVPGRAPTNVERYLVSPMSSAHADGGFAAAVSIRSGHGSGRTDRVMRFTPRFPTRRAALRYAQAEGITWVNRR